MPNSSIAWNDSGTLGVTREVPGGTIDPGRMLSGLAHAASKRCAQIFENAPVENLSLEESPVLNIQGKPVRARCVLIATNAESLELSGLAGRAQAKFTMAVATEPLSPEQISSQGSRRANRFIPSICHICGAVSSTKTA